MDCSAETVGILGETCWNVSANGYEPAEGNETPVRLHTTVAVRESETLTATVEDNDFDVSEQDGLVTRENQEGVLIRDTCKGVTPIEADCGKNGGYSMNAPITVICPNASNDRFRLVEVNAKVTT
jgi:hypothetical protein